MGASKTYLRLLLFAVAAVAMAAGLLGWFIYADRTVCVSEANYKRISTGMTMADVESLLGGPGQEILPDEVWLGPPFERPAGGTGIPKQSQPGERHYRWVTPGRDMAVVTGMVNGRVCESYPIVPDW